MTSILKSKPSSYLHPFHKVFFAGLVSVSFFCSGCAERAQPLEEAGARETGMMSSDETELTTTLLGGPEGDPSGTGVASVTLNSGTGEVCYEIEVSNIAVPTMAHIHEGSEGETGGVVVNFNTPDNGLDSCISGVDTNQIEEILEQPGNFYVNVHNTDYPGGAVRGQLSR